MVIVSSINQVPIRLTIERWEHIIKRHPELEQCKKWILETVQFPELIQEGDYGELLAIRFFEHTPLTSKYLITAYKEMNPKDGFVLTAYFSNKISAKRKILWKR